MYARHGRDLVGVSPLYMAPVSVELQKHKYQPKARAVSSGSVWREQECKALGRRAEIAYKAESQGKSAPHGKVHGLGDTVNAVVV